MLNPEILEWTEEFGAVTTFSFMVYGPFRDEVADLLIQGLRLHLLANGKVFPILSFIKDIDEDEARLMGIYQGTNIYLVMPEKKGELEDLIVNVTIDFFRFLRLKNEYLGMKEESSLV
tara:strand:+ start:87 stop:440 length:354 start_codon:yes stop_codon:yes gene_type:complete